MRPIILLSDGGKLRKKGLLVSSIDQAIRGAGDCIEAILLREQEASSREIVDLAKSISRVCRDAQIKILAHADSALLEHGCFDGVHLQARSFDFSKPRSGVSQEHVLGYSAHSLEECERVAKLGVDYVFLSPFFLPLSKPDVGIQPLGKEGFAAIARRLSLPIYALGGVTAGNAHLCRQAGAVGVAAITSVLGSDNPKDAAKKLAQAWKQVD